MPKSNDYNYNLLMKRIGEQVLTDVANARLIFICPRCKQPYSIPLDSASPVQRLGCTCRAQEVGGGRQPSGLDA
jgi:hypothetical protein